MDAPPITPDSKGQRALAAIVFTDGVSFSAKMSVDEEKTLELIRRDFQVMREVCWRFEGRVLKTTGDGLLMYFASAVQAVGCAVEIQTELHEAAALLPPDDVLKHRIGIHLGDVFISESDIMGNGVNIAARLQTLAEPCGICISQTVYDVVKTALSVSFSYMGIQKLKNIKEDVPVYHIMPVGGRSGQEESWGIPVDDVQPPQGLSQTTTRFSKPSESPYDTLAQRFNRESQVIRIKKLIFCACRDEWESDVARLERLVMRELCQELHLLNPTLEQLKITLTRVVRNLSKPAEYVPIAKIVAREFKSFYESQPQLQRTLYDEVAIDLSQNANIHRVKKLILCACRDQWESDPAKLDALNLRDLVQEIHEVVPSLPRLRMVLDNVVQTLNKQGEYALVANVIVQQLGRLYAASTDSQAKVKTALTEMEDETVVHAERVNARLDDHLAPPPLGDPHPGANLVAGGVASPVKPIVAAPASSLAMPAVVQFPSLDTELTEVRSEQPPVGFSAASPDHSSPEEGQQVDTHFKTPPHLFDLRQEIMMYTIPLRAKILLFSVLHRRFSYLDLEDWQMIKGYKLEELLWDVLDICKNHDDLQTRLEIIASCMDEPEEYAHTASVIAQATSVCYQQPPGSKS